MYTKYAEELFVTVAGLPKHCTPYIDLMIKGIHGEMALLAALVDQGGSAAPGDLSHCLCRSASRVANALNALEEKKYVTREHDTVDRRRVMVHITELGRNVVRRQKRLLIDNMALLLQEMGAEDAKEYVRLEKKLTALIRDHISEMEIDC